MSHIIRLSSSSEASLRQGVAATSSSDDLTLRASLVASFATSPPPPSSASPLAGGGGFGAAPLWQAWSGRKAARSSGPTAIPGLARQRPPKRVYGVARSRIPLLYQALEAMGRSDLGDPFFGGLTATRWLDPGHLSPAGAQRRRGTAVRRTDQSLLLLGKHGKVAWRPDMGHISLAGTGRWYGGLFEAASLPWAWEGRVVAE